MRSVDVFKMSQGINREDLKIQECYVEINNKCSSIAELNNSHANKKQQTGITVQSVIPKNRYNFEMIINLL